MHVFALVFPTHPSQLDDLAKVAAANLPFVTTTKAENLNDRVFLYSWQLNKVENEYASNEPSVLHEGKLRAFDGWALPKINLRDTDPLKDVEIGEYLLVEIDVNGNGEVFRNLSGIVPVYISRGPRGLAVSNRASTAAIFANAEARYDLGNNFWASLVGASFPLGSSTAFVDTVSVSPNEKLQFRNFEPIITKDKTSRFLDEDLREVFLRNRSEFWDSVYDRMVGDCQKIFGVSDDKTLFMSGGKDSRLAFALLKGAGLLGSVSLRTSGPGYSADTIVANKIASKFDVPIVFSDNIADTNDYFSLAKRHIDLVDGATSPIVPRVWFDINSRGRPIVGHESGTRESESSEHINDIQKAQYFVRKKLSNLDRLGVLKKDRVELLKDEINAEIEKVFESSSPENLHVDFYTTERVRHYLSAGKFIDRLSSGFAPYLLMSDFAMKVTYNIGQESRINEDFHWELTKRSSDWLVRECPLAAVPWTGARILDEYETTGKVLPEPIPNYSTKKAPILGGNGALVANLEAVREFVLGFEKGPVFDLVDRDAFARKLSGSLVALERDCAFGVVGMLIAQSKQVAGGEYSASPLVLRPRAETNPEAAEVVVERRYRDAVTDILGDLMRFNFHASTLALSKRFEEMGRHEDALTWLRKAAEAGSIDAAFALGRALWSGSLGERDATGAADWFAAAAAGGSVGGRTMLAHVYKSGVGRPANEEEAIRLFQASLSVGDRWAAEPLGELLLAKDLQAAAMHLTDAIDFYSTQFSNGNQSMQPLIERATKTLQSLPSG